MNLSLASQCGKKLNVLLLLLWAGCSVIGDRGECHAPVNVHVNDIRISQDDFPETKSVMDIADYTGVKTITLAFFKSGGSLQYNVSQLRANTETYDTFGDFTLEDVFLTDLNISL